jgi:hypothetical protein
MASTPIQEYIDKHGLQKKVEDVLNTCVQAKPADPLAFMVRGERGWGGKGGGCCVFFCFCMLLLLFRCWHPAWAPAPSVQCSNVTSI